MRETIEALIELQHVDDEIGGHRIQRDELAANLDRLKSILDRMSSELDEKREKLTEATRFYEEKQGDLQADADRLAKAKQKLAVVTRTKEYAAMQRELDSLRRKYGEDEQEIKRLAEAIEEYEASIAGQEGKLAELEGEVKREEAASADRLRELGEAMAKIDARKDAIRARLEPSLVRRYERVLHRREGKAVVPAMGGRCTGCQIRLPPQHFIRVQRKETLESCPNCQRYLYYKDTPIESGIDP